jgi:hypothetical protein
MTNSNITQLHTIRAQARYLCQLHPHNDNFRVQSASALNQDGALDLAPREGAEGMVFLPGVWAPGF